MNKPKRVYVQLGEYHHDLLILDSWINNRALSNRAGFLLSEKLQEIELNIKEALKHLADKRGCSVEELIKQVLNDEIPEDEENE